MDKSIVLKYLYHLDNLVPRILEKGVWRNPKIQTWISHYYKSQSHIDYFLIFTLDKFDKKSNNKCEIKISKII